MYYRMAAFTISAILISTLPCSSQSGWRGRPWHENTNAPTWQVLQEDYQPFEQLFEALVERADVVRATVNTNLPRLELVQSWTVDAHDGLVTNVLAESTVILASGFPGDVNGTYYNDGNDVWVQSSSLDSPLLVGPASEFTWYYTWEIYASYADFFPAYGSGTGPASSNWEDFNTAESVTGAVTVLAVIPSSVEVFQPVASVVTTNAFAPFEYTVEYEGTSYSGTGTPHLTYAAMEWIDQQIDTLSAYYVPLYADTNLTNSGASVLLWKEDFDEDGPFSLVGLADVGVTYSITNITGGATNIVYLSRYTRQPAVTSQWVLAEWAWGPTNWVDEVVGDETNRVPQLGWAGGPKESMDIRLPITYTNGPYIYAISATNGAEISGIAVDLYGDIWRDDTSGLADHWFHDDIQTNAWSGASNPDGLPANDYAPGLWKQLYDSAGDGTRYSRVVTTNYTGNTGDYVVVAYDGLITLYGVRPYRLYASDLEERAAVIDTLRYMPIDHDWVYNTFFSEYYPAFTNMLYGLSEKTEETHTSAAAVGTNEVPFPSWSEVIPNAVGLEAANPLYVRDDAYWVSVWLARTTDALFQPRSLPYDLWGALPGDSPTGYVGRVVSEFMFRSAQLVYTFDFSTNNIQSDNTPAGFDLYVLPTATGWEDYSENAYTMPWVSWVGSVNDYFPTRREPSSLDGDPIPLYTGIPPHPVLPVFNDLTEEYESKYQWQLSTSHALVFGSNSYTSARIGYGTNSTEAVNDPIDGDYPDNLFDLADLDAFTDAPAYRGITFGDGWAYAANVDIGRYFPDGITRRYDVGIGNPVDGNQDGSYTWRPDYTTSSSLGGVVGIPGLIDWGTASGFRYRAAD